MSYLLKLGYAVKNFLRCRQPASFKSVINDKLIKKIVSFDSVSPLIMGQLIENIEVYKSKKIVVNYKFDNPFQ